MQGQPLPDMVPVYKPENLSELAVILGILEEHDIPCFVHNSGFGSLFPGPPIEFFNSQTIMVPPSAASAARELIDNFLAAPPDGEKDFGE